MKDLDRDIRSLAKKILKNNPDLDTRAAERFISLIKDLVKDGRNNHRIDNEDIEILEEVLKIIERLRKEQGEPYEKLNCFMLLVFYTYILVDKK